MTFLTVLRESQKAIATGIALSFLLQAGLQAADTCRRSMRPWGTPGCERLRSCPERSPWDECSSCDESCPRTPDESPRGCTTCGKPKPKPKSTDPVQELVSTMMRDAADAGCSARVPQPVRNCHARAQRHRLTPEDVMHAMPTLMRYALEHMSAAPDARSEKAQRYVESLLSYIEEHADVLQQHPAREEVKDMLERASEALRDHAPLAERMHRVMERTAEPTRRSPRRDRSVRNEPTRSNCCGSACDAQPLAELTGNEELNTSGNFCLLEDSTANITITANNVSLDLNGRKLTGWINVEGENCSVKNGFVCPPAPASAMQAMQPGVWVKGTARNSRLCCLVVECDPTTAFDGATGNGFNGRDGIRNDGEKTFILDCCVTSGVGANADNSNENAAPFGDGGDGGCGINSTGFKAQIGRCLVMTGSGGNGADACVGNFNAGNGGNAGTGIKVTGNNAENTCVFDCKVITGDAGNGGNSCCENGGDGGNAGDGIFNEAQKTQITDCSVCTGNGGNGGFSDSGPTLTGGSGGDGGHGIRTEGTQITGCLIRTGNGGNGAGGDPEDGTPATGGNGGSAGHAIFVFGACNTEIRNNVVDRTGNGGNGGDGTTTDGNGGNGGDGVFIQGPSEDESQHTEVRFNTFSNMGTGGATGPGGMGGATAGRNGRAVTDNNNDGASSDPSCPAESGEARSVIHSNFAYAVAMGNTARYYLLNGVNAEGGVDVTAPPTFFDNVFAS